VLAIPESFVRQGIELRPLVLDDADELFAAIDLNRAYLRCWLAWLDGVRGAADVAGFIESGIDDRDNDRALRLGIRVQGRLRGAIGLHAIDWTNRSTSIGYWLDSELQGNGIMTACCGRLVDHVFEKLELHRIVIRCATGNMRSRAIPERLGFRQEGIARDAEWLYDRFQDMVIYARLRTD
jgi:ribosomal-protein-serine acetyltransferase